MIPETKDLREFAKRLKNIDMDKIQKDLLKELALRFLREVIGLTPVAKSTPSHTGGTLRRGWIAEDGKVNIPNESEIEAFVNSLKFIKIKDGWEIVITNTVKYASFVNYGHRLINGGWWTGYFFLEKAEKYINDNYENILNKKFEYYVKKELNL